MIKIQTIFIIFTLIILTGCGPSIEEKQEIAKVTCNFMSETRNMDSAIRLKEMNDVRERIGESKFLGRDYQIKESIQYGVCLELVLNDSEYNQKLSEAQAIYRNNERLRKEAMQKELDRINKERRIKEEEERAKEDKRIAEAMERWNQAIDNYFEKYPQRVSFPEPAYKSGEKYYGRVYWSDPHRIYVSYHCNTASGFVQEVEIMFKENLGSVFSGEINCTERWDRSALFMMWTIGDGQEEKETKEAIKEYLLKKGISPSPSSSRTEITEITPYIEKIIVRFTGEIYNMNYLREKLPSELKKLDPKTYGLKDHRGIRPEKFTTQYELQLYPL